MKKQILGFLLVLTSGWFSAPAWAAWKTSTPVGTARGISDPSCANFANNKVACAVMSEKSALMVNAFNGTSWGSWKSLAGTIVTKPSCTSDLLGNVLCAATTASGGMEVATYNGKTWSAPVTVAGSLYSAPSCAATSGGAVLCVARNSTGGLTWALYDGMTWGAFKNLSTSAVSAPSCASDGDGRVICGVMSSRGEMLANRYTGSAWQGFLNIGGRGSVNGIGMGDPVCIPSYRGPGSVSCFQKAYDEGPYWDTYYPPLSVFVLDSWSGFLSVGGSMALAPSCATTGSGLVVCGVIWQVDGELWSAVFNGSWSAWSFVGGAGVGSPSCVPLTTAQVLCMIRDIDNTLSAAIGP